MKSLRFATVCLTAAAIMSSLTSCDSESKLARNITGTWATTPEKLIDHEAMNATAVRMFQFNPSSADSKSGDVQMTALVSITNAMPDDSVAIIEPFTVTASGLATISGVWATIDDDEISIHFDDSSLEVKVDPAAVMVSVNTLTNTTTSSTDSIRPAMAASLQQEITNAVRNQVFDIKKLDDIKITKDLLSCEINKHDITLRRQNEVIK